MRALPYFPIVPQNAPPDDLRSYLELYSREAVGMQPSNAPSHAEWDVNLPIPRMRQRWGTERSQLDGASVQSFGGAGASVCGAQPACGPVITPLSFETMGLSGFGLRELREFTGGARLGGLGTVGQPLGRDPQSYDTTRVAAPYQLGDIRIVPALWVQRALNAAGIRTVTDGIAGLATLAGLRTFYTRFRMQPPAPSIYDRTHVSMSLEMELAMASLTQVADVAPSAPTPAPAPEAVPPPAPAPAGASGGVVLAVALGIGAAMWFGRRTR